MKQVIKHSLADRQSHYDEASCDEREPYQDEVRRDVLNLLPRDVGSILDLGCGDGFITNQLPRAGMALGVDISSVALRQLEGPACLATITRLPLPDRAFDLVMANDVIEHIPLDEFPTALRELERVAARYIITTVPFAEDLLAGSRYFPGGEAFHHVNEHMQSFDLPLLAGIYQDFEIDSAVFSGTEWQSETGSVETFKAFAVKPGTETANRSIACLDLNEGATEILQCLRAHQARALGRAPDLVDDCRLRTEVICLYRRRDAEKKGRPVANHVRESSIDAKSLPTAAVDLNRVDFRNLDRHRGPWLPVLARFPYLVTAAQLQPCARGARLTAPEGTGCWELKVGFFCNFEGACQLVLVGSSQAKITLSIAHYGAAHDYRHIGTVTVAGPFSVVLDVEVSHSQYGVLFSIAATGDGILLETIAIRSRQAMCRSTYPQRVDYLHTAGGGVDCFLSGRYYGNEVPVLTWFEAPTQVRRKLHPGEQSQLQLAAELVAAVAVAARHEVRSSGRAMLRGEVEQMVSAIKATAAEQWERIAQLSARLEGTSDAVDLVESLAERLKAVEDTSALEDAVQTLIPKVCGVVEATSRLEALARTVEDTLGRHEDAIQTLIPKVHGVVEAASRAETLARTIEEILGRHEAAVQTLIPKVQGLVETAGRSQALARTVEDVLGRYDATVQMLIPKVHGLVETVSRSDLRTGEIERRLGIVERVLSPLWPAAHAVHRLRQRIRSMSWLRFGRPRHQPAPTAVEAPAAPLWDRSRAVVMLVADDRIDRRVLAQARSLTSDGWHVTVVAVPYPEAIDADQQAFPEIRITRIDTQGAAPPLPIPLLTRLRADRDWKEAYFYHDHFLAEALATPAAIVTAHDLPVLPAAVAAADYYGARLVYDAHELYPEQHHFEPDRRALYSEVENEVIGFADAVTTVNRSIAEAMAERYGIPVPRVVLNAVAVDPASLPMARSNRIRDKLNLPRERKILLYQGGLSFNRNLENLTRAAALARTPDLALVFLGPGTEKRAELMAIAAADGTLDSRVFFLDAVDQRELLEHTASADVGVIPYPPIDLNSRFCTPNKLFEYIAAGLPILANDLPELRRFVHDNGFGEVHSLDDPADIATAIDRMFASDLEGCRRRLDQRCREFTWEQQAGTVCALYAGLQPRELTVALSSELSGLSEQLRTIGDG